MKFKCIFILTMALLLMVCASGCSEEITAIQSQDDVSEVVIPDGFVSANDGRIVPRKIGVDTIFQSSWNEEKQEYMLDNEINVSGENAAEEKNQAIFESYYKDVDRGAVIYSMTWQYVNEPNEMDKKLFSIKRHLRTISHLSAPAYPLGKFLEPEAHQLVSAFEYADMQDLYEYVKRNDSYLRNYGIYVLYDMLSLPQTVFEQSIAVSSIGNTYWEWNINAVFYSNLCEVKNELAEINSAVIKSNPDRYGYLALPAVREGALSGDAASVDVVEKIMEKTASDTRFTSASSVSEWISANKDIIDSIEYIIKN